MADTDQYRFRRRDFVRLLALLGLAATVPLTLSLTRGQLFMQNPFRLGVASGDPTADGVVLWTRLVSPQLPANSAVAVSWQVFELNQPENIVARGEAAAIAELAHSVHVEVAGLQADTWYGYQFSVAGHRSVVGRTRTLPQTGANVAQLTLAYASCQRYEDGYFSAYRAMLDESLDLVCFVGDYIYEYASRRDGVRSHTLPRIKDLQGYRARYELYKSDADLQAIHAHCPWLVVWDDHEVENNYFAQYSTEGRGDISALRSAAYQAFYEHMPLRASRLIGGLQGLLDGKELRLYQQLSFGKLASLYLLDNRQYRHRPLCGENAESKLAEVCQPALEATHTMLGDEQQHWLEQQLASAGGHWQLLVQQTRFTPANYAAGFANSFSRDTWDGYPAARQLVLQAIQQPAVKNVIVLGGDIHQNWVARVHANPYDVSSPVIATEFCGTSISSRSATTPARIKRAVKRNPHLVFANAEFRGYGVLRLTMDAAVVSLKVVDTIADPKSTVSELARFRVPVGKPAELEQL